jgi:flagellar biosynthesis/type III secretory pathway protein FliH
MKSFNSSNEMGVPRSVQAWMPVEFKGQEAVRLQSAQELLEILAPLHPVDQADPGEKMRIIRAADSIQYPMKTWNPGDILQQPVSKPNFTPGIRPVSENSFPSFPQKLPERHSPRRAERLPEMPSQVPAVVDEKKQAEIMAEARARADQIILQAQANAAEIIERSKEEARLAVAEGFRKGSEDGYAEAASSIQAVQAMIAEASAWREQLVAQNEEVVIDMIRRIAKLMFGEGIQLDKNALQIYLNEVMETTRSLGELNIFLSPADYQHLDPAWAEYYTQIRGIRVTVIGSNNVLPGGCYIQGQMGTVDAQVETKLSAVMETLERDAEMGASE